MVVTKKIKHNLNSDRQTGQRAGSEATSGPMETIAGVWFAAPWGEADPRNMTGDYNTPPFVSSVRAGKLWQRQRQLPCKGLTRQDELGLYVIPSMPEDGCAPEIEN